MAYKPVISGGDGIVDGSIVAADVATGNIDGPAATPSLRTLGLGAQQALPGNSSISALADVDTTGVVDGALLRYESSVAKWLDTTSLLLLDSGLLRLVGAAGIEIGGADTVISRVGAAQLKTDANFRVEATLETTARMVMGGPQRVDFIKKTSNYIISANGDYAILGDTSSLAFTITLPATFVNGDTYLIKRLGANGLNVATSGGALIDGVAGPLAFATSGEAKQFISDGTNWFTF